MKLIEAFKLALQSLWGNKLRSILTLIGVVMGVASVIMVITLVNGANKYVSTKLSGYGADVFTVTRMPSVIFTAEEYLNYQKRKIIRIEDYQAVKDACTECSEVGALLSKSTNVVANGHSSNNTSVRGYTWTMLSLNNIDIALGRGFTPADEDHATKNVIVGYDIVDNLLGDGDPIGKEIRVDGIPYTIVGVGDRQGKTLGQSQDNWVAIPITTYQQIYGYNDSVDIYARTNGNAQEMERAEDSVRVMMRTRRHNAPGKPDDFDLETNDTFLDIWKQISSLFAWVVLGLASIALVVGGVVIMNIMLVSVTERTREIGVRKALGAKQRDVLMQFLIESASLALVGGAIGVLGGIAVGKLITIVVGFPTAVPLWAIFLGLVLAGAVGIFFGVYPASKAARLDPVVALRAEM
ncbi:MAG TPA: ABC transporter permease [Terracidiphilus sp.]|jgi:putative ABC transport system permease protein|nr:ABC transporter permease [Terracidiphilus sp.]